MNLDVIDPNRTSIKAGRLEEEHDGGCGTTSSFLRKVFKFVV